MSRREWTWVVVAVLCAVGWFARPLSYEPLVSVLLGAAIGAVVSWYFYQQASDDLRDVHDQTVRMLQTISGGGRTVPIRDEQGKLTGGVAHYITVTNQLDTTDSVQGSTGSDEDGDPKLGG
jgi:hypothetical protein